MCIHSSMNLHERVINVAVTLVKAEWNYILDGSFVSKISMRMMWIKFPVTICYFNLGVAWIFSTSVNQPLESTILKYT